MVTTPLRLPWAGAVVGESGSGAHGGAQERATVRQPGYLVDQARGFAAPPHDGCAFSLVGDSRRGSLPIPYRERIWALSQASGGYRLDGGARPCPVRGRSLASGVLWIPEPP